MTITERILRHPLPYLLWQAPFVEKKLASLRRHTDVGAVRRVLDVGCGPGTNARHFAAAGAYVGIDFNERYIEYASRRHPGQFVVADVTDYEVSDEQQFDLILVNSLLHHITAPDTRRLLAHLRTLLAPEGHVHMVEVVMPERRGVARFLAKADRGAFARPLEEWRELIGSELEISVFEPFRLSAAGVTLWEMVYVKAAGRRSPAAAHASPLH